MPNVKTGAKQYFFLKLLKVMLWYKSILVPFTDFNVDNFAILSLAVVNIKYLKTLTDFYFLLSQKVGLFK